MGFFTVVNVSIQRRKNLPRIGYFLGKCEIFYPAKILEKYRKVGIAAREEKVIFPRNSFTEIIH